MHPARLSALSLALLGLSFGHPIGFDPMRMLPGKAPPRRRLSCEYRADRREKNKSRRAIRRLVGRSHSQRRKRQGWA